MKEKLTKIILAGVAAAVLCVPLIADARGRGNGHGLGNGFTGTGFAPYGTSIGATGATSRQGIRDGSPANPDQMGTAAPNFSGSSSGPGLEKSNKRSR